MRRCSGWRATRSRSGSPGTRPGSRRDRRGRRSECSAPATSGLPGTKLLVILVPSLLTLVPAAGLLGGIDPRRLARRAGRSTRYCSWRWPLAILFFAPKVDRKPGQGRSMGEMLAPLKHVRVWRFSLYYVVVFGAYVALSAWLPDYYRTNYFADLPQQEGVRMAALLTALFIFPASLLRPLGGYLSDQFGPRAVTYSVFVVMTLAQRCHSVCRRAALPLDVTGFTALMFIVGVGMGIGKASVYKYVPNYFPKDVGAVGGLVGMLGALGGFILPKLFGTLGRATGVPQAAFMALLALTLGSLVWLHLVVMRIRAAETVAESELVAVPVAA